MATAVFANAVTTAPFVNEWVAIMLAGGVALLILRRLLRWMLRALLILALPLVLIIAIATTRTRSPDDCTARAKQASTGLPAAAAATRGPNVALTRNIATAVWCINGQFGQTAEISGGEAPPPGLPVPPVDPRPLDSERKILDRIAGTYHGGTGTLYLYTLIEPREFCIPNAIVAFETQEPGIVLTCWHGPYEDGADLRVNYPARGPAIAGPCPRKVG